MNLKLFRGKSSSKSTIGELFIDGVFECYVLEDVDRFLEIQGEKSKILGETAIPRGKYSVVITYSNRFNQLMPLLLNVPNYAGVRIHTGNKAEHTEGCILLGETKGKDFIGMSRSAYSKFMTRLSKVSKTEKIFIQIS